MDGAGCARVRRHARQAGESDQLVSARTDARGKGGWRARVPLPRTEAFRRDPTGRAGTGSLEPHDEPAVDVVAANLAGSLVDIRVDREPVVRDLESSARTADHPECPANPGDALRHRARRAHEQRRPEGRAGPDTADLPARPLL